MKHRTTFVLLFLLLSILGGPSCISPFKSAAPRYPGPAISPPGTILVGENFYCDYSEATTADWLEYMSWLERIYGWNSAEYKAALPDSTVWKEHYIPTSIKNAEWYILFHPKAWNNPVVGLSQEQIDEYAQWRSDRVLEILLIRLGKIQYNEKQNKDNYFTIDKYFSSNYNNILPDSSIKYFPNYRLPSLGERSRILAFADSLLLANPSKQKSKKGVSPIHAGITSYENDSMNPYPTQVAIPLKVKAPRTFYHLKGNVSEWSSQPGIAFGGSWNDSIEVVQQQDTFHISRPNGWTGFRMVCEWKKVDDW